MAQYSYKEFEAVHANSQSSQNGQGPKTHFVNEYLKNDGDTVIVRFPYHDMDDVYINSTHLVKGVFPGNVFGKRVRCTGDDTCPLCRQGVKIDDRFFVQAICYIPNSTGGVDLIPAVWDRAKSFAELEIKTKLLDYGDLTKILFKIRRTGTGLETKYSISPVINTKVYSPDVYKEDFSALKSVDSVKILTKSMEQYTQALREQSADNTQAQTMNTQAGATTNHQATVETKQSTFVIREAANQNTVAQNVDTKPIETQVTQKVETTQPEQEVVNSETRNTQQVVNRETTNNQQPQVENTRKRYVF